MSCGAYTFKVKHRLIDRSVSPGGCHLNSSSTSMLVFFELHITVYVSPILFHLWGVDQTCCFSHWYTSIHISSTPSARHLSQTLHDGTKVRHTFLRMEGLYADVGRVPYGVHHHGMILRSTATSAALTKPWDSTVSSVPSLDGEKRVEDGALIMLGFIIHDRWRIGGVGVLPSATLGSWRASTGRKPSLNGTSRLITEVFMGTGLIG